MIVLLGPLPTAEDREYWAGRGVPWHVGAPSVTTRVRAYALGQEELDVCEHPGDPVCWEHLKHRKAAL